MRTALLILLLAGLADAQLIPAGMPVPRTPKPPVLFLNGYQTFCTSSQFADTFGKFDQFLQATGRVSVFFDNCAYSGKPSIEVLGGKLQDFLGTLTYTDGTPVPQVDIVAHSMGGLIVRSYLSGKQTMGMYQPPANTMIRKAVFLATPHFGAGIATLFPFDAQTQELATGSTFVFDLGTWNQSTDDLRGVNSLALVGNGGTSPTGDGVASLTSASLEFAEPGRTRVLPYCHTGPGLVTLGGLCPPNAPGIALGVAATDTNVMAVSSFLNDTPDWQVIGKIPSDDAVLSKQGGIILRAKTADDQYTTIQDASASKPLTVSTGGATAYSEFLPAQMQNVRVTSGAGPLQTSLNLPAGYTSALTIKNGPVIAAVLPAAAKVFPLDVAPGTFIAIYGSALAPGGIPASPEPYPTTLGGVQILVDGAPVPIQYVSPTQVNAIFPLSATGLVRATVKSGNGQSTVNVLVQAAVPALFTQDGTMASALNAITGSVVSASAPLSGGDYVSLYLTGLGQKQPSGGLQVAILQPTVTIAGNSCNVTFAGAHPVYEGLDQINCQVPTGVAANPAAPVIVTSGGRSSNTATLALH